MNIVGVVTVVEDDTDFNGKAYKKVTLGTGQELKVKQGRDGVLKEKWGLLKEGVAIAFKMQDFTKPDGVKIPFVFDIALVGDELQPPVTPDKILPGHQEVIQEARAEVPPGVAVAEEVLTKSTEQQARSEEISKHVWYKELGNRIGDGSIDRDYPKTAVSIKSQYYSKMFKVTGVKPEKES